MSNCPLDRLPLRDSVDYIKIAVLCYKAVKLETATTFISYWPTLVIYSRAF